MFWGCGVTPQAIAESARVDFMITHEPGQMFLTDLPREGGGDPDADQKRAFASGEFGRIYERLASSQNATAANKKYEVSANIASPP
jgi:hypothetical protein